MARLEEHKDNHKIIVALISLDADPNPIAHALQPDSDEIVDTFLDEFESSANRSEMVAILEAMMTQPEFAPSFFRIKTWDQLSALISMNDFSISSEALHLFTQVVDHEYPAMREAKYEFTQNEAEEVVRLFNCMFHQDSYLTTTFALITMRKLLDT